MANGVRELTAPAGYILYATTKNPSACRTPFAATIFQADKHSALTAVPGATPHRGSAHLYRLFLTIFPHRSGFDVL